MNSAGIAKWRIANLRQAIKEDEDYLDRIGCAVCEDDVKHREEVERRMLKARNKILEIKETL